MDPKPKIAYERNGKTHVLMCRVDGGLPCTCPPETCSYCGHRFPAPAELHHSERECQANQGRDALWRWIGKRLKDGG